MKHAPRLLALFLLLSASVSFAKTPAEWRNHYLVDSGTSADFKTAIASGVVEKGMCPFQAIAAAGPPGAYNILSHADPVPPGMSESEVILSQCDAQSDAVFDVWFRNNTQFKTTSPVMFKVHFVRGRVVQVDRVEAE